MAEKSASQQVQELKDLVVGYAKQETLDPLKGLARWVGFGLAGALAIGTGVVFCAIGLLRFLQTSGWEWVDGHGNSRWAPYAIVIVFLGLVAGLSWSARSRRNRTRSTR
jgi:H+/Cl- antiporter ClcA